MNLRSLGLGPAVRGIIVRDAFSWPDSAYGPGAIARGPSRGLSDLFTTKKMTQTFARGIPRSRNRANNNFASMHMLLKVLYIHK
jgi:hypothetical protein